MQRRWIMPLILAVCLLGHLAESRFVIEQGGLKITFPKTAAKAHPKGFDMSLANFGSPKYGGSLMGKLVYVDADHGHPNQCVPSCNYACQPFSQARPPFKLNPMTNPDRPGQRTNYIMLVDRGPLEDDMAPCKFAEKVWNAQEAGAQGVIVVNYEDKHTTMEAPDDQDEISYKYLRNITIPSAFITKSDGQTLKDLFKKNGAAEVDDVYVVLDWNDVLPRAQKVDWEFWTNSNDMCGAVCDVQREFIKEFVPVARELEGNWTRFTPHYIVWVCPESYRSSDECQSQCIHNGRYCTPDPDGDLQAGYSGRDIVQENLRQLCVFKLANESGAPWKWWEYVTRFGDECKMSENQYNEECAERVFNELQGNTWSSLAKLRSCIGDVDGDADNALMEAEMKRQRGNTETGEVYILPTIRINNGQYRGKLSYTEVLRAICAGFTKNAEPKVCMRVSVDDSCRDGSLGQTTCALRSDGKTKCENTFSGYECVCGSGYISHLDEGGHEQCLNINECVSTEAAALDPKCTCERCACKDTKGGYECIANIKDECAHDYGGCWRGDYSINGKTQTFHACKDNIELYKDAAKTGKPLDAVKLHECQCPPCFTEFMNSDGSIDCKPKCDLDTCDERTGICQGGFGGSGGLHTWAVIVIVFACLGVATVAGYAAYRYRLRSAMHQEIRAIMAQYMPLESQEGQALNGEAPKTPTNGSGIPHKTPEPAARSVATFSRSSAANKQSSFQSHHNLHQALTSAPPAISYKLRRITGPFRVLAVSPEGSFSARGYSSAEAAKYDDMQKPSDNLSGKWALVTGSQRGIGLAVAEGFSREGAKVILTCEPAQQEDLQKAEESCKKYGASEVSTILADLSNPKEAQRLGEEALKVSGGTVDILVNNAGMYYPMSFDEGPNKGQGPLDGSPDDWDKQTQVNLMSPMRLTRLILPGMKDKGEGFVVNICSIEALFPYPSAPAYSATKWGLRGWSKALYAGLKTEKIKVLTVNPAQTSTPMTWSRPGAECLPDKMIQPDEIAEAILMTFKMNPHVFIEELTLETAEKPKQEK